MHSREIEAYKRTLTLTQEHREMLIGLLLGDACLESQNGGRTYRLKIEQSAGHEAYVAHLYAIFRDWVRTPPRRKRTRASNGTIGENLAFQTLSHEALRPFALEFYSDRRKKVPERIGEWLTPRGLAYWFMDDGSMKSAQSKGVLLNTQAFSVEDVKRLAALLSSAFGLKVSVRDQRDGQQIYVSGKSYEDLSRHIAPYVIDAMRYKMPLARRTPLPKR